MAKIPYVTNSLDDGDMNTINRTIDVVNKVPDLDKISDDAVGKINTYVNNIESVGTLLANKGVIYPLKNEEKDGIMHPFDEEVKNVILDAKVFNPTPGKVYSIQEVLNGGLANGVPGYGIGIEEYDEIDFASSSDQSRRLIINARMDGAIPKPTESIQTIDVTVENTRFVVTVDFSAMTLNALYLTHGPSPKAKGNIIHPNNYIHNMPSQLELSERNKGVVYPLRNIERDNAMHPVSNELKNVVLDAKVIGAEEGKVYAISYIANGAFDSYGFYIDEYDESEFGINSSVGKKRLVDISEQPFENPNGGVVTRVAQGNNGTKFILTIDYSEITGTYINNQEISHKHGYGTIIDKSNYIYKTNNSDDKKEREPLKVLMVGNSYARDITNYIHNIAASANVDCVVGVLFRSGESLEGHWTQASTDASSYTYYRRSSNAGQASNTITPDVSIKTAVGYEAWDIITFQQSPWLSPDYLSYQPYLNNLIDYISNLYSSAEYGIHMTWADSKTLDTEGVMYDGIIDAYIKAMNETGIGVVIPTGTVVENARTNKYLNNVEDQLTNDGYHLGDFGDYVGGLAFFESLLAKRFNKDIISDVNFIPESGTPFLAYLAKIATKNAVINPFKKTEV